MSSFSNHLLHQHFKSAVLQHIQRQTDYGDTVLHWVASHVDDLMCKIVIAVDFDSKIKNSLGMTAFHIACEMSRVENVRVFLDNTTVDINAADAYGNTPLHYTALTRLDPLAGIIHDHFDVDRMIYPTNRRREKITLEQCHNVSERLFNYWKKFGVVDNHNSNGDGNAKKLIAEMLLERGAVVDARNKFGATPLHAAIYKGEQELVKVLIDKYNADVNAVTNDGATPLHFSIRSSDVSIIQMLLRKKANVNATYAKDPGTTALHTACRLRRENIVQMLLHHGADIEARIHSSNMTPLHHAISYGYPEIVHVLLHYGADVDAKSHDGNSALFRACQYPCNREIIRVLLYYGADINARATTDKTLLQYILTQQSLNFDLVNYFLECGPNIDIDELQSLSKAKIINEYIIKMQAIDRYPGAEEWQYTENHRNSHAFKNECRKEVEKLKESMVSGNISFYDILTKDGNQVAIYTRNEAILRAMDSREYITMFPIFRNMLYYRFKMGQKRRVLIEPSVNSFGHLVGFGFPLVAIVKVMSYLSNEDLRNLIEAFPNHVETICSPKRVDIEKMMKLPVKKMRAN